MSDESRQVLFIELPTDVGTPSPEVQQAIERELEERLAAGDRVICLLPGMRVVPVLVAPDTRPRVIERIGPLTRVRKSPST